MIRFQEVDLESETIGAIHSMRILTSCTVEQLKAAIGVQLSVLPWNIRCVVERYGNNLRLLDVPSKSLFAESFQKTNKVYNYFLISWHYFSFCYLCNIKNRWTGADDVQ